MIVDQVKQDYTLEGYFRVWWNDWRLRFNGTNNGGCVEKLIFRNDWNSLWTPDLYFENVISLTSGSGGFGTTMEVMPDGDIFWSRQTKVTLRCPMNFANLPFDTQECSFLMGMWSQTAAEVVLTWRPNVVALKNWDSVTIGTWTVTDMRQADQLFSYASGDFSYASATLHLTRRDQAYVTAYIFSSVLFVFVSYAGCWVNPAAVPARAAIAVIALIVVFNTQAAAKRQFPPFAYATWLTDFLFISGIFNLIMFFEFACVNYGISFDAQCAKAEAAAKAKEAEGGSTVSDGEAAGVKLVQVRVADSTLAQAWAAMKPWIRSMKDLDKTFRWLFPLAYFIFLMIMVGNRGQYEAA